jgi:hypothetical protein
MTQDTLEILDLERRLKSHAIDGLYLRLAEELSYISELKNLRATANRLVDNGKTKATLIVRQLDTKLEKQSSRAHSILSDIEEHEERVDFLQFVLAQENTNYSDSQMKNIKLNRQSAFFAAMPISELPVPGDIHEFCPELNSWPHDNVFWTQALKPITLLQTPDTFHSTRVKQDACGNSIADSYPVTEAVLS